MIADINEVQRQSWLEKTLAALPPGARLLDAGAGELKNRLHCAHLDYVSQDFCQYQGADGGSLDEGLQPKNWDTSRIDLVSDITARSLLRMRASMQSFAARCWSTYRSLPMRSTSSPACSGPAEP